MKNIFLIIVFMFSILFAETFILYPTDDMYTDSDHPGVQPDPTQLWTADFSPSGHFERIMMKFELSELEGMNIESALLQMTRLYSCPSGGTTASTFYPISQDWTESTWNHTQHIQYSQDFSLPYVFVGPGGNTNHGFSVDVKSLIQYLANPSIENQGFVIKANANNKFSKFYSKEHANESYRPYLIVEASSVENSDNEIQSFVTELKNYPNPFKPSVAGRSPGTKISFNLKHSQDVTLEVLNIKGEKIVTLIESQLPAGDNSITWNGRNFRNDQVSSGVYFYRLQTKDSTITRKMILMK